MAGDLCYVEDCSNENSTGDELPIPNPSAVQTPTELGDYTCFSPAPSPRIYSRGRARQARLRISNHYQRRLDIHCTETPERRRHHRPVARTLNFELPPEQSPSSVPAPKMAGNIYMVDYQRGRPATIAERQRRSDSPDSDAERDSPPLRERTARRTLTRLLNHVRVNHTLNESALQCLNCGLLPSLPVTGICGHTRCTACIRWHTTCPCGVPHTPWLLNVDVVVQDVVHKLLATEPELRQWLSETQEHNSPQQEYHFTMPGVQPSPFAVGLYVALPPEATEAIRNAGQKENGVVNAVQGEAAAIEDNSKVLSSAEEANNMEEDGAWALPEAEIRARKMEERLAKHRIPITPLARLQYGTHLMEEYRYKESIPHLARAAIDSQIARPARCMLTRALLELSRLQGLGEVEGELRQAISAQATSNWLRSRDLECVFCYDTYCRPVTTPCGHTFCRPCLERSLDYRTSCALCMQSLQLFQFGHVGVNQFLTTTLQTIGGERVQMPLDPHTIPILACTVAFPGMPCPLFLFDPRYWYMIRRILETNSRRFGMVAYERSGAQSQYGTILEIRDCVHLQDGCTIVSTVGVSRFRVVERGVWDGWCDVAKVETVTDIPIDDDESVAQARHLARTIAYKAAVWISGIGHELRVKIETAFGAVPCLDTRGCWWTQPDGPAWLWWLISILPLKLEIKILILATDSLLKRMRAVLRTLDTSLAQPPHSVREYESALADWWTQRHL